MDAPLDAGGEIGSDSPEFGAFHEPDVELERLEARRLLAEERRILLAPGDPELPAPAELDVGLKVPFECLPPGDADDRQRHLPRVAATLPDAAGARPGGLGGVR